MYLQRVLFNDHTLPDTTQQIVLGDKLPCALHQSDKQVEGVRGDTRGGAVSQKLTVRGQQLETPEPEAGRLGCRSHGCVRGALGSPVYPFDRMYSLFGTGMRQRVPHRARFASDGDLLLRELCAA